QNFAFSPNLRIAAAIGSSPSYATHAARRDDLRPGTTFSLSHRWMPGYMSSLAPTRSVRVLSRSELSRASASPSLTILKFAARGNNESDRSFVSCFKVAIANLSEINSNLQKISKASDPGFRSLLLPPFLPPQSISEHPPTFDRISD